MASRYKPLPPAQRRRESAFYREALRARRIYGSILEHICYRLRRTHNKRRRKRFQVLKSSQGEKTMPALATSRAAAPAPAPVPATRHGFVGERDDRARIHCARLGRHVLPSFALEEVLDNDVKNMNDVCGCCRVQCCN